MIHPDWLIGSNFRLRVSENWHTESHQNSWSNKASGLKKPASSISGRGARALHHDEAQDDDKGKDNASDLIG